MEGFSINRITLLVLLSLLGQGSSSSLLKLVPTVVNAAVQPLLGTGNGDLLGISHDPNDVHFYLYYSASNSSARDEIIFNNTATLTSSHYQTGTKTIFMIHGFINNATTHFPTAIKNAYLNSSLNYNYIVVDWGQLATSPGLVPGQVSPLPYTEVVITNIPIVAKRVADFIRFLNQNNQAPLESIHIVGHSLGAHISGLAGNITSQYNNGTKIARITGLDPAGPAFDGVMVQRPLEPTDGNFVDAYHAAMVTRGTTQLDGQINFYPNGGITQPGCAIQDSADVQTLVDRVNPLYPGSCSHEFVVDIYAATISRTIFTACKCEIIDILTNPSPCLQNCENPISAGEPCPSGATGEYYFETSNNP